MKKKDCHVGRALGKAEGTTEDIMQDIWNDLSEEDKAKLIEAQNQQVSVSSRTATPEEREYFNTLLEGQCDGLCSSGKCNADCCGCVNILESHFRILKKLIPEGKEYYPVKLKDNGYTYIKPMTKNFKCVFLTNSNSCAIYNSHLRPSYCKRFGEEKTEPLYACVHINQDMKAEIEEFAKLYLMQQAGQNNPVAQNILKHVDSALTNNENV